jgi:hypothetical protein
MSQKGERTMTKVQEYYADFLKTPNSENGHLQSQYIKESKNPIETDVLRCPKCNSRALYLRIEHHFKAENDYWLTCGICHWHKKNPFSVVWAYCDDNPKSIWIRNCIQWGMELTFP